MIIVGAKGFAKEILEELISSKYNFTEKDLFFYDDVSDDLPDLIFGKFRIIRTTKEVEEIFNTGTKEFVLGVGNPNHRKSLTDKFEKLGGELFTVISDYSRIGSFENIIGKGANVMGGVSITYNIKIGKGCLININTIIGHDSVIGNFVELSPNTSISGHCKIGDNCSLGTGAIVIPKITIGNNCIIGAGTVVTKDIPDNSLVVGIPGKVIKKL